MKYICKYLIWPVVGIGYMLVLLELYLILNIMKFIWDFKFASWKTVTTTHKLCIDEKGYLTYKKVWENNPIETYKKFLKFDF